MSHRAAAVTVTAAILLDAGLGLAYAVAEHLPVIRALYCAVGNAVTEGACTAPATAAGRWIDLAEFLLVVPLFAATFSLFTSGLTAGHVRRHVAAAERRIKEHVRDVHDGGSDRG